MAAPNEVTRLLQDWGRGEPGALDRLLPLVYDELRRLARSRLRRERSDHTLQPTALVHEAYLRLLGQQSVDWQNRAQFYALAARAMRRLLVEHARRRRGPRRNPPGGRVPFDEDRDRFEGRGVDVEALDQALSRLAELDPRGAQIVELRYFGGRSIEETARMLDVSPATVKRDWAAARAWLFRELGDPP